MKFSFTPEYEMIRQIVRKSIYNGASHINELQIAGVQAGVLLTYSQSRSNWDSWDTSV